MGGGGSISTNVESSSVLCRILDFFGDANENYFMAAFFLISGIFCPASLDRKGFCDYVLDKLVRLGGPYLIYHIVLGPLLYVWTSAYAGIEVPYFLGGSNIGPPWFIFWLLNFSILYAVIAQVMPVIRFKMPNPVLFTVVGGFALGVVFHLLVTTPVGSIGNGFWNMSFWTRGISVHIPFFIGGIIGGRNGWLDSIENMSRWCKWTLRVIVGGILLLILLSWMVCGVITRKSPKGISWLYVGLIQGVYPVAMTLMQMQMFHEFLNVNNKFLMGVLGVAAYTVYVIHPWFLAFWTMIYIEILKAVHVPIVFDHLLPQVQIHFYTTDAAGKPTSLSEGTLFGGIAMLFVLTQLTVWPAAYYLRKLPVLNKML